MDASDTVGGHALADQYRREHYPSRAPHETAAMLLSRAGDRLEHRVVADYIRSAGTAIRHRRVPADVDLSDEAIGLALDTPLSWVTTDWYSVERPWDSLPADELLALMSVGFGEDARYWELRRAKEAGELDSATLDSEDYSLLYASDRQPAAIMTVFFGCFPGLVAGIACAIVVGFVSGSGGLALMVVVGATVLGYGLTFVRGAHLDAEDRERQLGDGYDAASTRIFFGSGPAVAVVLSILALLAHALA